jgi:hypothetical protein
MTAGFGPGRRRCSAGRIPTLEVELLGLGSLRVLCKLCRVRRLEVDSDRQYTVHRPGRGVRSDHELAGKLTLLAAGEVEF